MRTSLTFALALCLVILTGPTSAQQLLPGEREATVTAIAGVIAAGAKWELVWADFETADGINGTADGGVLFAQTPCASSMQPARSSSS